MTRSTIKSVTGPGRHARTYRRCKARVTPATTLACLVSVALCLAGCGSSQEEEAALSPEALSRQILHLEQGASVESVRDLLGEPDLERSEGSSEGLSYGVWELAFVDGRLSTRSKVIVRKDGPSVTEDREISRAIRRLQRGTRLRKIEAILGSPEVVYVIYEGQTQPVRVLRYGSWELTFVRGVLTLRAR